MYRCIACVLTVMKIPIFQQKKKLRLGFFFKNWEKKSPKLLCEWDGILASENTKKSLFWFLSLCQVMKIQGCLYKWADSPEPTYNQPVFRLGYDSLCMGKCRNFYRPNLWSNIGPSPI